ncbi:MAG TPA: isoprenylcysteine carboxylmethyltransferase family protein [Terriglobales bacterium]|nr:isoprenylcysteine carboxylmethyltransferase family protein [Terriglobales bacterium]
MCATTQVAKQPESPAPNRRFLRPLIFLVVQFALLFITSGRIAWAGAWLFVAVCGIGMIASYLLVPRELLNARGRVGEGWKKWDKFILPGIIFGPIVMSVVAGLDVRYAWTRPFSLAQQLFAVVAVLISNGLTVWAMRSNRHFEGVVRIQKDRDHKVVTSGPYAYARHPGYVGMIVFYVATPLVLGSRAAVIPAAVVALVLIARTALEDRMLRQELPGYREYAERVRCRLLPLVW